MRKPKLLCDCIHILALNGRKLDPGVCSGMFETTSWDGNHCSHCGFVVYKDYGQSSITAERESDGRNHEERRKYGKRKRTFISEWHQSDNTPPRGQRFPRD